MQIKTNTKAYNINATSKTIITTQISFSQVLTPSSVTEENEGIRRVRLSLKYNLAMKKGLQMSSWRGKS